MPSDSQKDDTLIVAGKEFSSRLIIGTGKYKDYAENAAALEASGADMVLSLIHISEPTRLLSIS